VSFRIINDKLNPTEISQILGVVPDKSHSFGEPNITISKKGKLIEFAPHNIGLWSISSKLA
jgi:hypothetical protein